VLPGDPFRNIGALACDPASAPFSMAVDRRGIAWVLYQSGKLYRVSIVDAHCAPVRRADDGPLGFGMGFASDAPGDEAETLYVAANAAPHQLARVDTTYEPPRWSVVGPVASEGERGPELTGTADAKLFGYFPEPGLGFVQEIDRATAKRIGPRLSLGPGGPVGSWAFAHWGGVFYVFTGAGDTSAVHAVHRNTGAHELVIPDAHHAIVGAGVSTCAPELEQAR
jgi:hypothetical protein